MSNLRSLIFTLMLAMVLGVVVLGQMYVDDSPDGINWGVSFSKPQAEYLGNNWQDNFTALLDDMEVQRFRLMSYWNQIEPEDDSFDFTDLDWQMNQAAERGAKVSLAIGYRQPRWPECHIPKWLDVTNDSFDAELDQHLMSVATRYRDHPALISWQLENEVSNRLFGECEGLEFDTNRLQREITLLNRIAPNIPIYNSTGNQSGIPIKSSENDGFAFSIYDNAHFEAVGRTWKWNYWYLPPLWHSARAQAIEIIHDKPVFIHELQLEPWGYEGLAAANRQQQDESMSPQIMREQLDYVQRAGFETVYLWGGEWWYQQLQQGNNKPWQVASSAF